MASRPKTLARVLCGAFGALCVLVFSSLTREITGDFIGGWVSETIGGLVGVGEPQVKAFIAAWLLPLAVVAAAMWFTAVVTRWWVEREHNARGPQPSAPPANGLDREALAREAETLHREISTLVGDGYGSKQAAWLSDARGTDGARASMFEVQGAQWAKYAQRYSTDVHSVVSRARKVISLDLDKHWMEFEHAGPGRLEDVAKYLAYLANELRHPYADIPMHSRLREEIEEHHKAGSQVVSPTESPSPRSPPSPATGTRP